MASIDCTEATARRDEKYLSFRIWCDLYWRFDGTFNPHPVMSPDLHGPSAGPRRPGTMIFKC